MVSPKAAELSAENIVAIGDFATGLVEGVSFRRLAQGSLRIPQPPRFLFGNVPEALLSHFFSGWGLSSIGVFVCKDVTLIGEYLVGRNDHLFRSPELNIHPIHIDRALQRNSGRTVDLPPQRVSGRQVILAGPGYGVYGHWLVEYLPKLSVLHLTGYDLSALSYLIPITVPKYVLEWLRILGIPSENVTMYDPENTLVVDELLLPTILHSGVRVSPLFREAAKFLKELIVVHNELLHTNPVKKRLFVSRKKVSRARLLVNRDRIEEMAVAEGFTIVYPEELTLLEQVILFSGASHIIGEYGSALHGSMFSGAGTVVCALRGNAPHPGFLQSGLGEILEQPTGYVIGENLGTDLNSPFSISESAFETCLKLIFRGVQL